METEIRKMDERNYNVTHNLEVIKGLMYNICNSNDVDASLSELLYLIMTDNDVCDKYCSVGINNKREISYYRYQISCWLSDLLKICEECSKVFSDKFDRKIVSSLLMRTKYAVFSDLILDSKFKISDILTSDDKEVNKKLADMLSAVIPSRECEYTVDRYEDLYHMYNYEVSSMIYTRHTYYEYIKYRTCRSKYSLKYPWFSQTHIGNISNDRCEIILYTSEQQLEDNNCSEMSPIFVAFIQCHYLDFIYTVVSDILAIDSTRIPVVSDDEKRDKLSSIVNRCNYIELTILRKTAVKIAFKTSSEISGEILTIVKNNI